MPQTLSRFIKLTVFTAVLCYLSICGMMWYKQRDFLFTNHNRNIPFESLGLAATQVVWLETVDGEKLESFYHPAPAGRPIVLFFHGKGTEISNESKTLNTFAAQNFGFLAVSYRGYGKSTGQPSETGLITDATTAFDWAVSAGYDPKQIMVLGQSLGSGVAVQLATQRPVAALALGAPYTSTVEIAENAYWYLPVRLLMQDQFWSSTHIKNVTAPLFILHGTTDRTIPVQYGKNLFELANEPKQLKLIEGEGHPIIFQESSIIDYANFFNTVFVKTPVVQ